jgi:hypothetical protein
MVQKRKWQAERRILLHKTVSMKVEQEIIRCHQVVDYHRRHGSRTYLRTGDSCDDR